VVGAVVTTVEVVVVGAAGGSEHVQSVKHCPTPRHAASGGSQSSPGATAPSPHQAVHGAPLRSQQSRQEARRTPQARTRSLRTRFAARLQAAAPGGVHCRFRRLPSCLAYRVQLFTAPRHCFAHGEAASAGLVSQHSASTRIAHLLAANTRLARR
jgi:hypothetical protein